MPDATLQLRSLRRIWRPVYTRRLALHATADAVVLAAWKTNTHGIDLAPAVSAWRHVVGEATDPLEQHRRQAAGAAILTALAAHSWQHTRQTLTEAARRAHRAGWAAGHHLVTGNQADDGDYDEEPDTGNLSLGSPNMTDSTAHATSTATLAAALSATARRAGRAMADSTDDPRSDAEDAVCAGLDLALAADVAVSAAYGAGLLAAYVGAGVGSVMWLTAGDGRVCDRCLAAEAGSPYSLLAAPRLPQHPRCRCVLAPT